MRSLQAFFDSHSLDKDVQKACFEHLENSGIEEKQSSRIAAFMAAVGAWLCMLVLAGGYTVYLVLVKGTADPYGAFAFAGLGAIVLAYILNLKLTGVFFVHLTIAMSLAGHWLLASGLAKDGVGGSPMGAAVAMGLLIFLLSARFSHFLHQIVTAFLLAVMLVMAMIQKSPDATLSILYVVMFTGAVRFLVYPSKGVDRRPMALAFIISALVCDVAFQLNSFANTAELYSKHSPAFRGFSFIFAVFVAWPNLENIKAKTKQFWSVLASMTALSFLPLGGPVLLLASLAWRTGWAVLFWLAVLVAMRTLADFYLCHNISPYLRATFMICGAIVFGGIYYRLSQSRTSKSKKGEQA